MNMKLSAAKYKIILSGMLLLIIYLFFNTIIPQIYFMLDNISGYYATTSNAVSYQRMLAHRNEFLNKGNYQAAIDKHIEAADYFDEYNIAKYGIRSQSLSEFASTQTGYFTLEVANHFIRNNQLNKALNMLKNLQSNSFSKSKTKSTQIVLGTQMAKRDYSQSESYKQKITLYTRNNSWFKYFGKAYKKEWKKQ